MSDQIAAQGQRSALVSEQDEVGAMSENDVARSETRGLARPD